MSSSRDSTEAFCRKFSGSTPRWPLKSPTRKLSSPSVSCSGGVDERITIPLHTRRIPQNRYLMIFGLNRQIVRDLPKQGYPWQQPPPARQSLGTNPTDVLMF